MSLHFGSTLGFDSKIHMKNYNKDIIKNASVIPTLMTFELIEGHSLSRTLIY